MDKDKTTFETWNKNAQLYQEKFMNLSIYNNSYDLFCKQLVKTNPSLLDIGCGPGNITKYLISIRPDFKITGIDISPNMIELAKVNNPTAEFRVMDCRELNNITEKYDGIICGFCIPYLSKEESSKLLKDSFKLLKENGVMYFSTIDGDYNQSGFKAASTGDLSYVYYYDMEHFQNELINIGFKLVDFLQIKFPENDGTYHNNQIFIAKK